jgi:hypothetical protein
VIGVILSNFGVNVYVAASIRRAMLLSKEKSAIGLKNEN